MIFLVALLLEITAVFRPCSQQELPPAAGGNDTLPVSYEVDNFRERSAWEVPLGQVAKRIREAVTRNKARPWWADRQPQYGCFPSVFVSKFPPYCS